MKILIRFFFTFLLLLLNLLIASCSSLKPELQTAQESNKIYGELIKIKYSKSKKDIILTIQIYNNSPSSIFVHKELRGLSIIYPISPSEENEIDFSISFDGTWLGYITEIKPKKTYTHNIVLKDKPGYNFSKIEGTLKYAFDKDNFAKSGYEGLKVMEIKPRETDGCNSSATLRR